MSAAKGQALVMHLGISLWIGRLKQAYPAAAVAAPADGFGDAGGDGGAGKLSQRR